MPFILPPHIFSHCRPHNIHSATSPVATSQPPAPKPLPPALPKRLLQTLAIALVAASTLVTADPCHAYGLIDGRLEKCKGDLPCISTTSVGNPSKFGPPWSFQPQTGDAETAWASLKIAIEANKDGGKIVETIDGPEVFYLRAEFPSSFRGMDDIEFRLIRPDALVTYRSASREALFIYPLQTPINTDKNRNRLEDIRKALGWEEFGGFNVFGEETDAP